MKNLFRITVKCGNNISDIYVITTDANKAEKIIEQKFKEWNYFTPTITKIERLAVEGQYGKPEILLEAK